MMAKLQGKLKVAAPEHRLAAAPKQAVQLVWLDAEPGARGYHDFGKRYSVASVTTSGHELWEVWKFQKGSGWFTQIAVGLKSEALARAAAQRDSES